MSSVRKLALVVLLISWLPALLFAQGGATGAITGTVQDPSGGVLAGARVDVISESTGQVVRQLTTNTSGLFAAPLLPVGNYSLEVSASALLPRNFPESSSASPKLPASMPF
jgi:hypothetical protein